MNRKTFLHSHLVTQGDTVKLDAVLAARRKVGAEDAPKDCRFYCRDVEVVFVGAPSPTLTAQVKKDSLPLSKPTAIVKVA